MKLQINDPRLLQYVLNEISSEDLQLVESAIDSQPEIHAEIVELKRVYGTIVEIELAPKDMSLSAERRKKLFQKTIYKKAYSPLTWIFDIKKWRYAAGGLIAATFAFLVFNHSLKKEVSAPVAAVRPTIPVDSDRPSEQSPIPTSEAVAKANKADSPAPNQVAHSSPPSLAAQINNSASESDSAMDALQEVEERALVVDPSSAKVDAIAKNSTFNEDVAPRAESKKVENVVQGQSAANRDSSRNAPVELNKLAAEKALDEGTIQKEKMFASSKKMGTTKVQALNSMVHEEDSGLNNSGLLSAFGGGGVNKKKRTSEKDIVKNSEKLQVFISSRALESEQIKTMTNFISSCLQQFTIDRELKITFEPHDKKYSFTTLNPSNSEKDFARCAERAFVQPLAPYIKFITVELKYVSK